ncbi:hypothetical protein GCM10009007_19220 [Formosimonas limnophila]|uniref:Protein translocase subunit SecE n=1 Tax=Formosimonas limnophila TaxID=1384487 RepID=A0A8J3FZX8_9BURK|nr:preprotein translocase subunit SecE [Formosimonas limnophila]GHA78321.1 hypothetical protein GCM10009007_19220 [Formosimonas limnophila]
MSQTQEISDVRSSNWGIWASIVILAAAFLAYFFAPQLLGAALPAYAKPVILAVGFILAIVSFFVSPTGKTFMVFSQESFREARKVVWPTRKEVLQMTGVVFAFVVVVGLFVWAVDTTISEILRLFVV